MFVTLIYEEKIIEKISTTSQKFTQCSNSKCGSVFPFESVEDTIDSNFLCPVCREKISTHHIVECENCHSLVNFITVEEGEEPIVFYVKKCHHCSGSYEEERIIQPFDYRELYI